MGWGFNHDVYSTRETIRHFPGLPQHARTKITLADLEDARKTLLQHNKTADSMPPGIKHMYM
jgi:hypothetical protein